MLADNRKLPDYPHSEQNAWYHIQRQLADQGDSIAWLQREVEKLTQLIELQQCELAFYKSESVRTKGAHLYAQDAVAAYYGFNPLLFHDFKTIGRPTADNKVITEGRYMLYTILNRLLGWTVPDISDSYGHNVKNHIQRWKHVFTLIHNPRHPSNAKNQQLYDQYAPAYRQIYFAMREALINDGFWQLDYADHRLDTV